MIVKLDPIRIVLADDAVLLREALAAALAASGFDVVGQASDVPGLLALVERGAAKRPRVARELRGRVEIRFAESGPS